MNDPFVLSICFLSSSSYRLFTGDVRFLVFDRWTTIDSLMSMIVLLGVVASGDRQPNHGERLCTGATVHSGSVVRCGSRRWSYARMLMCNSLTMVGLP